MSTRITLSLVATGVSVLAAVILWRNGGRDGTIPNARPVQTENVKAVRSSPDKVASDSPVALVKRLFEGDFPKLTPGQIDDFVKSQNHSAMSLLAAWSLGSDESWLKEAAERHPDDPRVAIAMLMKQGISADSRNWIESLKRNDPGNALGHLYGARLALSESSPERAISELSALENSPHMDSHTDDWRAAMTAAYQSAGYGGLEAEWLGLAGIPLPIGEMSGLGKSLAGAMTAAAEGGDRPSAETLGRLGLKAASAVASRGERDLLINQLVSVSMERALLNQLHTFDFIPGDQKIVVERLAELDQRISRIKEMTARFSELGPTMTDSELRQYTRRVNVEGELKAMEWLSAQRGNR